MAIDHAIKKITKACKRCGSEVTRMWWKCCPKHTTQNGSDVVCEECALFMHPGFEESEL